VVILTDEERKRLPFLEWLPSRIPVRDALVASVPKDVRLPEERIPPNNEIRWYPHDDESLRLLMLYSGQSFDPALFHVEEGAWDHTTCDLCVARIPPLTLCYVTKFDPYIELCSKCYEEHVVNRSRLLKRVSWRAKRLIGIEVA
jgi:hypothetical protein